MALLTDLEQPFGTTDEVLAISTREEHSYNVLTSAWYLPPCGNPKLLMTGTGTFGGFGRVSENPGPGLVVNHESYDGEDANTKGWDDNFYVWNPTAKTLTLQRS